MKHIQLLRKILIILAILVCVGIIRDMIVHAAISTLGSGMLGAPLRVKRFSMSLILQRVSIKGLTVGNPSGFDDPELLADIPELTFRMDSWALFTGKLHLPLAVIDIRQMTVVKNKDGKLNVEMLKIMLDLQEQVKREKETGEKPTKPPEINFHIDTLKLNVGRIVYKDYTAGSPAKVSVYDVGLKNKTIRDIDSMPKLVTMILAQALGQTAIRSAGMYAATTLLGVGFLPAGVLGVIVADDDDADEFRVRFDKAYDVCLQFIEEAGRLKSSDKDKGVIEAEIHGLKVKFNLEKIAFGKTKIKVSARKYMLPKRAEAAGILHQISQRIK